MIFVALLLIYILAMMALGFIASKRATSATSYAASSGDVGPVKTALTFAACFASAGTYLGVSGQGYAYGLTNLWFWASQWTTSAIVLALVVKRYRTTSLNMKSVTVADWISDRYKSQGLRVFIALVSMLQILYVASQLVGLGIILNQMVPMLSYKMAVTISAVVIIIYLSMGGTYAHVYTNTANGTLMAVLSIIIFLSGFYLFGNIWTEVPAKLAAIDPNLAQGLNPNNPGYPTIVHVVGLFVAHAWWALNPQLINKANYLKSNRDIKKFVICSALFMFAFSMVTICGSYTRILFPEGVGGVITTMDQATPTFIATVFPEIISAVFLVVIVAATMSTVDGIVLYMSSVIGNTLYKETYIRAKKSKGQEVDSDKVDKTSLIIMRCATIAVGLIAIPVAYSKPENLTAMLWTASGTIMSAVAGPVCIGLYNKNTSGKAAALGSVGGCAFYCITYFGHLIGSVYLCCGLGGIVSVTLTLLGSILFKPMDSEHVGKIFAVSNSKES